jgi:hypothetical protein
VKAWTDWESARHQVAIGGRVVDESEKPVAGAEVTITVMPEEFQRRIAGATGAAGGGWEHSDQRLDRSLTKADGIYYFLDLPGGKYTVKAVDIRSGARNEKTVSVSWNKDGKVQMAVADLKLSKAAGER